MRRLQWLLCGSSLANCTVTASACKVGRCELGANDTFQTITEVCCSGGTCTTERYKLCGC